LADPGNLSVHARLTVLKGMEKLVWTLSYATVRRTIIEYPSDDPLFPACGPGFGDWGYHELTDAGGGFFRHEVLFASGSVLLVEFKEIAVVCRERTFFAQGPPG